MPRLLWLIMAQRMDLPNWIQEKFPTVTFISFQTNLGFCGGYNEALKRIPHELVVLLNSDVEVTSGWLQSPINLLKDQVEIAAVQPKILSQKQKSHF